MKNGWQTKDLGDLCQVIGGGTPSKTNLKFYSGDIPWATVRDMRSEVITETECKITKEAVKSSSTNIIPKGNVVIATRVGLGKVCLLHQDTAINQDLRGIVPIDPKALSVRFLFWWLKSIADSIVAEGTGATVQGVKLPFVESLQVPLPRFPEQQRIVGILDEAFEGIATAKTNAEKNLKNARDLFESLLNVAIQGKLIPQDSRDTPVAELISRIEKARIVAIDQGRAKPEKTELVESKDKDQVKLPSTWEWAQLESLTVGISDGVHKKPQYASKGIPFITVKNLTAGPGISFDDLNYITREDHKDFIKRTRPEKGDILITKDGTIGVVRLIETDIEFSIFVSVALIKPVLRELGPYLVYALRASCVQSQIVPQGAALKHLYLVDLRRLAIPLPPLSEQNRIVASLDSLTAETQRLESIYQGKLAALEALQKSLLHQAFTGKL